MASRQVFNPLLLLAMVTILASPCPGLQHNGVTRYRHFEDYLRHMDSEEQAVITDEANRADADSATDDSVTTTPSTTTNWESQRDTTCCMLGQIAGDKGYHCFARFYAARLLMRNRNRAHNRKMGFYGRNRIPDYGRRLMRTFETCVMGDHGTIFHKCCHMVAVERRDRDRYDTSSARAHASSSAAEQTVVSSASHHGRSHHHRQHRTEEEANAGTESSEVPITTTTTERPSHQQVQRRRDSDEGSEAAEDRRR